MANETVKNRAKYLAWLRTNFPELYFNAIDSVQNDAKQSALSGFFDSIGDAFSSVVSNISKSLPSLAQTYSQYESQKNLLSVNTQRAQQGLAPLQYNSAGQLVTAAGLPYTAADYQLALHGGTGMDTTTLLLLGGALLLVVILLVKK